MNKFVKLILPVLAIASIGPVLAEDHGNKTRPTVVVPKESGLTLSASSPTPLDEASFSGQVWVEGLFLAQWPANDLDELHPGDKIEVSIKLDEKERKRLPHYDWPEWNKTYIAESVDIKNPDDAVKLVFSKEMAEQVLGKKVLVAKVHARFLLTDYEVGIECDWPWAHAKLISADVKAVAQTSKESDLDGC